MLPWQPPPMSHETVALAVELFHFLERQFVQLIHSTFGNNAGWISIPGTQCTQWNIAHPLQHCLPNKLLWIPLTSSGGQEQKKDTVAFPQHCLSSSVNGCIICYNNIMWLKVSILASKLTRSVELICIVCIWNQTLPRCPPFGSMINRAKPSNSKGITEVWRYHDCWGWRPSNTSAVVIFSFQMLFINKYNFVGLQIEKYFKILICPYLILGLELVDWNEVWLDKTTLEWESMKKDQCWLDWQWLT